MRLHELVDTFDGPGLAAHWPSPPAAASVADGRLRIAPPGGFASLQSSATWDAADSHVLVHVDPIPGAGGQTYLMLISSTAWDDDAQWYLADTTLVAQVRHGVDNAERVSVDFDPERDAWWRIDETAGAFVFSTSPDGAGWVERARMGHTWPVSTVSVALAAADWSSAGRHATFDDLNAPPAGGAQIWRGAAWAPARVSDAARGWLPAHLLG